MPPLLYFQKGVGRMSHTQSKSWQHVVATFLCVLMFFLLISSNLFYMLNCITSGNFLENVFKASPLTSISATYFAEEDTLREVGLDQNASVSEYILAEFLNGQNNTAVEVGGGDTTLAPTRKVSGEEIRDILDRTTLDDFMEERIADMFTSMATGKTPKGMTADEVNDLLKENEAVIMEYTDEPIGEGVKNAVNDFFATDIGKALSEPTSLQTENNGTLQQLDEITRFLQQFNTPIYWILLLSATLIFAVITVLIHSNRANGLIYGGISTLAGGLIIFSVNSLLSFILSALSIVPETLRSVSDAFINVMQQSVLPCAIGEIVLSVVMIAVAIIWKSRRKPTQNT